MRKVTMLNLGFFVRPPLTEIEANKGSIKVGFSCGYAYGTETRTEKKTAEAVEGLTGVFACRSKDDLAIAKTLYLPDDFHIPIAERLLAWQKENPFGVIEFVLDVFALSAKTKSGLWWDGVMVGMRPRDFISDLLTSRALLKEQPASKK